MNGERRNYYVYYLVRDTYYLDVVYIGKTNDVRRRAQEHRRSGKIFDYVGYTTPMTESEAEIEETNAIRYYQDRHILGEGPKYNIAKVRPDSIGILTRDDPFIWKMSSDIDSEVPGW